MDNSPNLNFYEDVDSWETLMFLYNAALKEINTKIEILNDEFQHVHHYTPIEHIKSRIKTPESIVKKLKKNGYEVNVRNMVKHVRDIAGVRIICSFTSDIYLIADMITKQGDLKIIFSQRLYQASQGQRLPELPYACIGSHLSVRRLCRYQSGNPDTDRSTGFLGQPGTQDLLQI